MSNPLEDECFLACQSVCQGSCQMVREGSPTHVQSIREALELLRLAETSEGMSTSPPEPETYTSTQPSPEAIKHYEHVAPKLAKLTLPDTDPPEADPEEVQRVVDIFRWVIFLLLCLIGALAWYQYFVS